MIPVHQKCKKEKKRSKLIFYDLEALDMFKSMTTQNFVFIRVFVIESANMKIINPLYTYTLK